MLYLRIATKNRFMNNYIVLNENSCLPASKIAKNWEMKHKKNLIPVPYTFDSISINPESCHKNSEKVKQKYPKAPNI